MILYSCGWGTLEERTEYYSHVIPAGAAQLPRNLDDRPVEGCRAADLAAVERGKTDIQCQAVLKRATASLG